jgi:High potential iron-sulfur protein
MGTCLARAESLVVERDSRIQAVPTVQPWSLDMTKVDRRTFFLQAVAVSSTLTTWKAVAQPARVAESDPQAAALGYKHDTKAVDKQKFPKHEESQICGNCQLFQAKPQDEWGPCALFAGKQVAGPGWCSAWIKKPG